MSLIVTVTTSEGVVMASDSRSTMMKPFTSSDGMVQHSIFPITDTVYKTVLIKDRIGVSTCGGGHVAGMSISWHIETFANQNYDENDSVNQISEKLLDYFLHFNECPVITLHVVGYDKVDNAYVQSKRRLKFGGPKKMRINQDITRNAFNWDGESTIMSRLLKPCYMVDASYTRRIDEITISSVKDGAKTEELLKDRIIIPGITPYMPQVEIDMQLFTLQDGIDFAKYAISTTIETMRFLSVSKTVGGPIDILVIKPGKASWIAHKTLHA